MLPGAGRQKLTKVFHIEFDSEVDEERYVGKFTTKKLNIQDHAKQGVILAQLNGGMHYDREKPGYGVDASTSAFNGMLAHLSVALTAAPDWWDLSKIGDVNVIYAVYEEVAAHEATFRRRPEVESDDESGSAGQGDGSGEDRRSDGSGATSQVVDEEIQSALKP